MNLPASAIVCQYMEWAKTCAAAQFNLATSGVENYPANLLPFSLSDIELNGVSLYGYQPLQQALASKCRVSADSIVAATGTSMANFLAMAAVLERGDEILIEAPVYQPLLSVAEYLGAQIKRIERRFAEGFVIDLDRLADAVSERTRLIVITNLHNPSSAEIDLERLAEIGKIANKVGAWVLVDEVYLESRFDDLPGRAFQLGENFIITSSLTKAYGLSGLRCGWIIAEPALAKRIWRLNDLFGVVPAHPAERLSVIALNNLEQIGARAAQLLNRNRQLVNAFLDSRNDLAVYRCANGTVLFPKLLTGSVDQLATILREKYQTSIVPGHFFDLPDHFRIGYGVNTETVKAGLERLNDALDQI